MDFVQIVQVVGVPLAVLAAFGIAVWRVLNWCAINVVLPVTQRHITLIDQLEKESKSRSETEARQTDTLARLACLQEDHADNLRAQTESLRNIEATALKNVVIQEGQKALLDGIRAASEEQISLLRAHQDWAERTTPDICQAEDRKERPPPQR